MKTLILIGLLAWAGFNAHAKESWVTQLPREEIQRMLGLQRPPQGRLDFEPAPSMTDVTRESVDWRSRNGSNWLGPVMNQGNCGSCVAFATIATLEAQTSISMGVSWLHPSYSTDALFSCGGGGCGEGWTPESAVDYLQNSGVPDEACLPNTSGSTGVDATCSAMCSDWTDRNFKILSYATPTSGGGSVSAVKAALKKGPLITTLSVYEDFLTYGSGVYKHRTGEFLGGHAVSLVGFDDAKRAWLVRNSWGPHWGDNGFVWVSWDDESGVGAETWSLELGHPDNFITVTFPADLDYVSGAINLTARGQWAPGGGIRFHVIGPEGHEIGSYAGESSYWLDTLQLPDGHYEIYAENLSSPSVKSQVREFYVINQEPRMSLSFTPVKKISPNVPINGRPEFNITTSSSPVPIQHLEFRVFDQQGKVVSVVSNNRVLPAMRMGWRTPTVPNGRYRLVVHGETNYAGRLYEVESNSINVTVKN